MSSITFLTQYLSLKSLDQIYKVFIRPHFDYCDVIYHIPHSVPIPEEPWPNIQSIHSSPFWLLWCHLSHSSLSTYPWRALTKYTKYSFVPILTIVMSSITFLTQYLSLKSLDQIYKVFIRPHFDYCDVIYHIPHLTNPFESSITLNTLMERTERIQYQAALAITGTWQGTSRNKLYDELGWESQ